MKELLISKDFYFSYTIDIINSLGRKKHPSYSRNDMQVSILALLVIPRIHDLFGIFLWQSLFCSSFLVTAFQSCVATSISDMWVWETGRMRSHSSLSRRFFDFIIITRRSRLRAGTRYKTRGVDRKGNVANFVETEQVHQCFVAFWR